MSNHRQSPDWRHSPPTEADVLSESTDLDSLLTAILGEKTDSSRRFGLRPMLSQQRREFRKRPCTRRPRNHRRWNSSRSVADSLATSIREPAQRLRQHPGLCFRRGRAITDCQSRGSSGPAATFAQRGIAAPAIGCAANTHCRSTGHDRRSWIGSTSGSNLMIVDEQLTRPSDPRGTSQVSSGEQQKAVDGTLHPVESPALDAAASKDARRLPLILVGVGVVVSGALITLNAIPRAVKAGEQPQAVAGSFTRTLRRHPRRGLRHPVVKLQRTHLP